MESFFNYNSWHKSITFPLLYILAASIPAVIAFSFEFDGILKDIISILFFTIFLTPVWVIIGFVVSKNKLPYIISLLAGIPGMAFISYFLLPVNLMIFLINFWSFIKIF